MNPNASEEQIHKDANGLKESEIWELQQNPNKWKGFIEKSQWAVKLGGGQQLVDAMRKRNSDEESPGAIKRQQIPATHDTDAIMNSRLGRVGIYRAKQHDKRKSPPSGINTNLDYQPPYSVLRNCIHEEGSRINLGVAITVPIVKGL